MAGHRPQAPGLRRTKRGKEAPPACPRLTQLAMEQRPRTPPMVRGGIRLRLLKDGSAAAPGCLPLPTALPGAVTVSHVTSGRRETGSRLRCSLLSLRVRDRWRLGRVVPALVTGEGAGLRGVPLQGAAGPRPRWSDPRTGAGSRCHGGCCAVAACGAVAFRSAPLMC